LLVDELSTSVLLQLSKCWCSWTRKRSCLHLM
jgi:hypothetical protein